MVRKGSYNLCWLCSSLTRGYICPIELHGSGLIQFATYACTQHHLVISYPALCGSTTVMRPHTISATALPGHSPGDIIQGNLVPVHINFDFLIPQLLYPHGLGITYFIPFSE